MRNALCFPRDVIFRCVQNEILILRSVVILVAVGQSEALPILKR